MCDHGRHRARPDLRFAAAREVRNEKPISGQPRLLPILGCESFWLTASPSLRCGVSSGGPMANRLGGKRGNRGMLQG